LTDNIGLELSLAQSGHVVMLVISTAAELSVTSFLIGNYITKPVPTTHLKKQKK